MFGNIAIGTKLRIRVSSGGFEWVLFFWAIRVEALGCSPISIVACLMLND